MGSKAKISTSSVGGRKSGRAVFDNQGRASWEWQATGVFETNVTHEQLQNLEAVTPARNPTVLRRLLRRLSG